MAEVFLARYAGPEGFEKLLVIKRVLPRISESPHLLRMFFEEAKTQVSFSHGNLVSVFDFGRVDNDHFIAMDYVRGADLASLFAADRAAGQRLAPSLLAHVGVEICRGLAYVHGRGFVHRDVTPRNVLLSVDGEVKLSDFGLALAMQSSIAPGRPGTRSYMSPEQARGDRVDGRADLYSLGLILAEGLLGRGPQANSDGAGSIDPGVLTDVATCGALGGILARAVAASPEQRFGGATEMLAALEAEIGRIGAGREALVRELASKVHQVSPDQETIAAGSPRAATVATAVDAEPTRESYFRDNRSAAFVDSILAPSQSRAPLRALRWGAALAGAAAVTAAVVFALRGERAGDAGSGPAPASGAVAPAPPLSSAPQGAPATIVPPTPPAETSPVAVAPAQRPARRAARAPLPSPSPSASPAPSGQLRILCTPWCVPYVDGKPVGQDGRSFVVPVTPGRHKVEARRLDDRLQQQLDVTPGQDEPAHFDFDDAAR